MAIEYCRPTSYTASAGLTNGANAYDADISTSATLTSSTVTTRVATSSAFSAGSQTWTSATLNIKYDIITQGDGGGSQWDSTGNMWYSLDNGGTWIQTSLSNPSFTSDNSGSGGPWTDSFAYTGSSADVVNVLVRMDATGHSKTGSVPNIILGSTATCNLYEAWIEGTYSPVPTVTNLNGGASCEIGSTFNITGTNFTGATAVSINSVSASFSVTNSTTISVTIPPMYITGSNITSCAVAVTTSAGTGTANVGNITLPSVSYSPTPASITQNTTQVYTASISSITPTTPHWYASSGSFSSTTTNPSTWTAPNPPLSDGYGTSITLWPDTQGSGVPVYSQSVSVYFPAAATSIGSSSGAYVTNGTSITLTPTFTGGSGHAYIGTTNGGTQVTAAAVTATGYSATPASNATTTYYLHVQNAATTNTSTDSTSVAITAVPLPTLTSFADTGNSNPANITIGYSATLTGTFSGAAGHAYLGTTNGGQQISSAVISGTGYTVTPTVNTTYYLHLTNLANDATSSSLLVQVYAAPTATIAASTTSPLYGAVATTITPTWTGASSSVGLSQGAADIASSPTSGVAIPVQNTGSGFRTTTTYWLRSINSAYPNSGSIVDDSVLVTPQTPTLTAITGNAYQTVSTAQTFGGAATGGAYVPTVVWSNSGGGGSWSGAQYTAGATPGGPFTITATLYANGFSTTTTRTFSVTLVATPSISSFTASTTTPLYGATNVTVTPTFSGGTATIGTTGAGTSDISANASTATPITVQGGGFITTKTYYLRVTNLAGTTTDSSVTITPQTVSVGAIGSGSLTRVYRTHTISLSATISGASNTNVNWTATGGAGSFSPSTTASGATTGWTAPAIKGNYTITATSAGDGTKTSTLILEVVTGSGKKSTGSSS